MQSLPLYVDGLAPGAPARARYGQPAAPETRARLIGAGVAVLGLVVAVTGSLGLGFLLLAAGGVGAVVAHARIAAAEAARAAWSRSQLCLACTHLWVP